MGAGTKKLLVGPVLEPSGIGNKMVPYLIGMGAAGHWAASPPTPYSFYFSLAGAGTLRLGLRLIESATGGYFVLPYLGKRPAGRAYCPL